MKGPRRIPGQGMLDLGRELIVDNFAGGGGASTGIERAFGRPVDVAINHDPEAIALHRANHPATTHYCESVFRVDPCAITKNQPVGLAWFSPDCTHHSKARGGKPRSKKTRGLAWVVIRWARRVRPRVIMLENVEEFSDWGPLLADGTPCPARRGTTFRHWLGELERCGYRVEYRELRACDYGAPTTRKRLFLVARRDGLPIVWPQPTHGTGRPHAYRTAAECIDWTIPCPSIFERTRPLAEATLRRIAHGIKRYVLDAPQPFVVGIDHRGAGDSAAWSIDKPLTAVTSKARHALVAPTLIQTGYGERPGQAPRTLDLHKPLGTLVDGQKHGLVAAFLAKHYGGNGTPGWPLTSPISTITTQDHHALVSAFLLKYYGSDQDPQLLEPLHTITTRDRFGLVTVAGEAYAIIDVGMRMLQPRELYRAQGFPEHYVIDVELDGRPLSKKAQVRMVGNSVSPHPAEALVRANFAHEALIYGDQAA